MEIRETHPLKCRPLHCCVVGQPWREVERWEGKESE